MGCNYPSSALSSYQTELKTEIKTNRKDLLPKNRSSLQSTTFSNGKRKINLDSSQNLRNFKTCSYYNKSSAIDARKNDLNSSKNFIPRLSLQKFNELFDDSTIEGYNKKQKEFNLFSFRKSYLYNKNNVEQSLNSTYEQTAENTIESEYFKNDMKINKIDKRDVKKKILVY